MLADAGTPVSDEADDFLHRIRGYWAPLAAVERQHAGVVATARNACADLADPAVARNLYFGCEPGAPERASLDLAALVSRAGDGRLLVCQPERDGLDALLAVVLKALFFEAVLADPDRRRADPDVPLVGYVCDEFHKYITSDAVHGEQNFVDSCRSHGALYLLATQSFAALEHALSLQGGSRATHEAALSVIWNNCASKLVFRTTDADVNDRIAALCPEHPHLPPVTRARPPARLAAGQCYALLADGRIERRRLDPWLAPPARRPRRARSRTEPRETTR